MIESLTDFRVSGVKGKIDVRYPTNGERMKLFQKAGLDFFDFQNQLVELGSDKESQTNFMQKVIMSVMDHVGPFCEDVAIEHKGKKVSSFEEISVSMELMALQVQIASVVLLGARTVVEKKAKKSPKRSRSSTSA